MRPGVSGRMTTDSFDFRLPTALASSEKSVAATFATSTETANPPAGPAGALLPAAARAMAGARFAV
jgi:hypothetical protein